MRADTRETFEQILKTAGSLAAPSPDLRAAFADRFEAELGRLARANNELDVWQEENLLSALGAAGMEEFELACAFVEAVQRPPSPPLPARHYRRPPMSVATLRRRFERMRAAIS
jgi:hypothetical protein